MFVTPWRWKVCESNRQLSHVSVAISYTSYFLLPLISRRRFDVESASVRVNRVATLKIVFYSRSPDCPVTGRRKIGQTLFVVVVVFFLSSFSFHASNAPRVTPRKVSDYLSSTVEILLGQRNCSFRRDSFITLQLTYTHIHILVINSHRCQLTFLLL